MNTTDMHGWRSRLPEWVDGSLSDAERGQLEAAMQRDPELRAEAELVRSIRSVRPEPPLDLATTISARLAAERTADSGRSRWMSGWRLSTAALLVLAMGTAVIWQNRFGPLPTLQTPTTSQVPLPDSWLMDDGVVAGGAVLDDLTDEELALLLAEIEG